MTWASLTIDPAVFEGRESDNISISTKRLAASKGLFRSLARPRLNSLIDSQGVTETVFYDHLANLTTSTDVYEAFQWSLGTVYLHLFYRGDYAVPGGADFVRSEDHMSKFLEEIRGLADLIQRAINQREIVFSQSTEVTRTRLSDRAVYTI